MEGYKATIKNCNRELTSIEKVKLKDFKDAMQLDDVAKDGESFYMEPETWAEVSVHNEHSKSGEKDYDKFVIITKDGQKYATGSAAFISSFKDIADEMLGDDTPWAIKVFRKPSKNYSGSFITCSITDVITE